MISGKLVNLRALEKQDMALLQKWMNDPDLTRWLGPRSPISLDEQIHWFDKLSSDKSKIKLLIEDKSGAAVGLVSLMQINLKDRSAEFGIYLGEHSTIGKGVGKDATMAMLKFGFQELGLIKIFLVVLEENERAIKSFLSCGFQKEAVLRQNIFFGDRYHNQVIMGILAEEFKSIALQTG